MTIAQEPGLLDGVRVLDLATPWAEMAGRMLADLGAEVIKIEPPAGAEARRLPPWDERRAHNGESLYWAALGLGKRSLSLDLSSADGLKLVQELSASADILIESFAPGRAAAAGLGYAALSSINPALIYVSVTPYGADGPKAAWPASELTVEAAGGRMAAQGDGDRPPLPLGFPQSAFHAGAQAACDAIIALNERALSGRGQFLDVSAQAAMVGTLMDATGYPPLTGSNQPRGGDDRNDRGEGTARPGATVAIPCKDGFVVGAVAPARYGSVVRAILQDLPESVRVPEVLAGEDWSRWEERVAAEEPDPQVIDAMQVLLAGFVAAHSKRELHAWATALDLRIAPINHAGDLLESEHLAARRYFREVGGRIHPGSPAVLSRSRYGPARPAPARDEARRQLPELLNRRRPPSVPGGADRPGEAFAGLKVADFTWVAAGPLTSKTLADHGATVVKIESAARPDLVRLLPPFFDGQPGLNRSQWMGNVNSSKLGITLNLGVAEGAALARRLVIEWADVVMDSFRPGTMRRFGLDYESLTAERPDLICFSTSLMGNTGPLARFGGYGHHGAAIAGMTHLTGWPDRPPSGAYGPYSDIVLPRFGVAILAAAILERRRTGKGIAIDLSQAECAARFLEPLLLDAAVNGRVAGPAGHTSAVACPYGVYRAAGSERFVALSVESAGQWQGLRAALGLHDLADPRFDSIEERRAIAEDLDTRISDWMRRRDPFEAERELCAAGVPAAAVARAEDLHRDPQLAHMGYFVPLDHPEIGRVPYDGLATRFSAKRVSLHRAAPLLGQHTAQVLREALGMDEEAIAAAAAAGALS